MPGAGYDISQSTSEANTLGFSTTKGDFIVGGGVKVPGWFWPVLVVASAFVAYTWLTRKG